MIKKSFMNILNYGADPRSIGDIGILDNNQLANGPGISGEDGDVRAVPAGHKLVASGPYGLTRRQAVKLDRLNVMGYYKNRGHLTSHRQMMAVLVRAGPKKG